MTDLPELFDDNEVAVAKPVFFHEYLNRIGRTARPHGSRS
jgi:hypothetical protein